MIKKKDANEEYVYLCLECCEELVEQVFSGDEGVGLCRNCGAIEGPTKEMTYGEFIKMQEESEQEQRLLRSVK